MREKPRNEGKNLVILKKCEGNGGKCGIIVKNYGVFDGVDYLQVCNICRRTMMHSSLYLQGSNAFWK